MAAILKFESTDKTFLGEIQLLGHEEFVRPNATVRSISAILFQTIGMISKKTAPRARSIPLLSNSVSSRVLTSHRKENLVDTYGVCS